ncbi:MAG: hypothetical protein V4450_18275 [Bacteroidota bacterium]
MKIFFFLLLFFGVSSLFAQQTTADSVLSQTQPVIGPSFQDSIAVAKASLHKNNMWVLAAWAGANIIQGSISAGNATGSDHYFHQMNAYWNTVNLAVAGLGLWAAKKQLAGMHTLERNLREQNQMEKLLLLNTGLDAAYIMTGLYLKERGNRLNRDQPSGYGSSLIIQGSFLLIFDIIQYAEHRRNGKALEKNMANWQLGTTSNGMGLTYRF